MVINHLRRRWIDVEGILNYDDESKLTTIYDTVLEDDFTSYCHSLVINRDLLSALQPLSMSSSVRALLHGLFSGVTLISDWVVLASESSVTLIDLLAWGILESFKVWLWLITASYSNERCLLLRPLTPLLSSHKWLSLPGGGTSCGQFSNCQPRSDRILGRVVQGRSFFLTPPRGISRSSKNLR